MDNLNKELLKEDHLIYYYNNEKDIPIGVLALVNYQLGIGECGIQAVPKMLF